jgi:galactokinase
MAIDRAIWIALRPRDDGRVVVHSIDFDQSLDFSLSDIKKEGTGWLEYIKGIAWSLQAAGHVLHGWEGVIAGDVPVGAGLSSSAAIEMAAARAFAAVSDLGWEAKTMARLGQRAENQWVGVNCGIMDQMVSAAGVAGHALLIDCRSLETQPIPLPPGTVVAVLDTATRRGLVDSAYNERRAQCEAAARFFSVPVLRDVTLEVFEARGGQLDERVRRRARHVITENMRTLAAVEAMRQGDAVGLGRLMDASHASLRDDFEVSSPNLNVMVAAARRHAACYGARMTGAGFGGCAVALVRAGSVGDFAAVVVTDYQAETSIEPNVYICEATDGAAILAK